MAESLAALGVAANIVQFLELGLKATISIEDADVKLDPSMKSLLQRSIDTADELRSVLLALVMDSSRRHRMQKWAKFKASVAAHFKKGKIDEIQARLAEIKSHIFERLQVLLYDHRLSLSRSMHSLEEASEGWNRATEKKLNALAQDLRKLAAESRSAAEASSEGLRVFAETWARVSEEARNQDTVLAILASLRFAQIKERQSEVPKAHRTTFEWVFSEESPVDFSAWLLESSGLFWITGKPGSGKSTLMKFLLGHERTMLLAEGWAKPEPLIVASHFFWAVGTEIQKSQEGLLRTLLFQVLVSCPGIISMVCPARYASPFRRLDTWSIEELSEAFVRLKDIRPLPARILLFVDGLDEYKGNQGDLVRFLRSTSESPYIKLCCASRPWPVFLNGFKDVSGQIRMHELTANDMACYVRDTLEQHSFFEALRRRHEDDAAKLVGDIAEKSEGVFFWVFLVVKSLLRGLDNSDDLGILQRRLSEFPSDLDEYFQRMLDTIENVYKENVSLVFSMLLLANSPLPTVLFLALENLVETCKKERDQKERNQSIFFPSLMPWRRDLAPKTSDTFTLNVFRDAFGLKHGQEKQYGWVELEESAVKTKQDQILAQCRDLVQAWEVEGGASPYHLRLGFLHRTVVEFLQRSRGKQWHSTLPAERYLLGRSCLAFVSFSGSVPLQQTEEFVLRLLCTLQGNTARSDYLTDWLLEGLMQKIDDCPSKTAAGSLRRLEGVVIQEWLRREYPHGAPGRLRDFREQYFRFLLHESGHVQVGDRARISWSRTVDLQTLEGVLGMDGLVSERRRELSVAFSDFLERLCASSEEKRPRNAFDVCKVLIQQGIAGHAGGDRKTMSFGPDSNKHRSGDPETLALTQVTTLERLRENKVFSEEELLELEEAFPSGSVPRHKATAIR
ncbi:Vegetative incompatibility protein HET-E-1 [Colletotrichum shisoi]|uniref:Vegetative incompatibility protein HET-E-1 n=1 Tax=Colletotrichum shisoi TaxID=2078593 RepID=A0A5Q4BQD2_9PEZI|nr:Vegetative incompatibility protein HET-E-1 [Colletotrichum shisoi]